MCKRGPGILYSPLTIFIANVSTVLKKRNGVRLNGFNFPPHPQQLLTYLIFLLDLISFYLINMTSLSFSVPLVVICSIVYFVLSLAVVILAVKATATDPSDPTIELHRIAQARGERFDSSKYEYFCCVCDTFVEDSQNTVVRAIAVSISSITTVYT